MTSLFDRGVKESYERLARQEVELARHIRDIIRKSDDTKAVFKLLTEMPQAYDSRVLLDSGEGVHSNGTRYSLEDFWRNVGEVQGLRWLNAKVKSMIRKAEEADKSDKDSAEKDMKPT